MDPAPLSRRRVLLTCGLVGTTGCLESLPLETERDVRLGSLFFQNSSGGSQSLQIQLQRNDDVVYEDDVTLADGEELVVDPTWSTDPADYHVLYARAGELGEASIPEDYDSVVVDDGCYHLRFFVDPLERLLVQLFDGDEVDEGTC